MNDTHRLPVDPPRGARCRPRSGPPCSVARALLALCLAVVAAGACEAAPPDEAQRSDPADSLPGAALTADTAAGAAADGATASDSASLTIHFSRGESTATVSRRVPVGAVGPDAALRELLRGPIAAERAAGIHSWFSDTTAQALRSVEVDDEGRAIVDFADLRGLIPNASTSAGSAMLLRELNGTVFALPSVESVEYRLEGSCEDFWEWLQYGGCPVQQRR